jgi:single-strand DNA-binding protein
MAKDLNTVQLIGRLAGDPETTYTEQGTARTTFTVATGRQWQDAGGQVQGETQWTRCVAWGKLGEIVAQYLNKGARTYVEGHLRTRTWEDAETGERHYLTEVIIDDVIMLDGRSAAPAPEAAPDQAAPEANVSAAPAPQRRGRKPAQSAATTQGTQRRRMPQPTDEDGELPF